MDPILKNNAQGPGAFYSITRNLFNGATSIAAAGNANSAVVDSEGFGNGLLYVDSANQFDVVVELSDDNTTYYKLDEKLNQTAGKKAFRVDLKGAKYIRINITNDGAAATSPTANIILST